MRLPIYEATCWDRGLAPRFDCDCGRGTVGDCPCEDVLARLDDEATA